jgi:hypothetical protein
MSLPRHRPLSLPGGPHRIMTNTLPNRSRPGNSWAITLVTAPPQPPSFQWHLRKSLWKKATDSGKGIRRSSQMGPATWNPAIVQTICYQCHTENTQTFDLFRFPNPSLLSSAHLLHSSPAKRSLRVTRHGICRIVNGAALTPGTPPQGARIVPLTRSERRTILARITREAAGERPRKLFRE